MKSVSSNLQTHFGLATTTLAVLWKITRENGTVLGFTSFDQNIVYQGVTFLASSGFLPSANENNSDLSVDSLEVDGFLDSSVIKESDIRNGLYDYAVVEQHVVNWADLTMGDCLLRKGIIGNIKMQNGMFIAEVRGLTQYLSTYIGSLYGPLCRAELYSTTTNKVNPGSKYVCWVKESDYIQNGTVGSSADALHIVPAVVPIYATPAFVQGSTLQYANGTSKSIAFSGSNAAGNLLIAYASNAGTSTISGLTISDTAGNTWIQLFTDTTVGYGVQVAWYCQNCKAGANTVTVSWTTGTSYSAMTIAEYSGVAAAALDQSGTATGTGNWSSSSITPSIASELVLAFEASVISPTINSPFTSRASMAYNGDNGAILGDDVVSSTAAVHASGTGVGNYVVFIASFFALETGSNYLAQKGSTTPTNAAPADWFTDGMITFTSGANSGFSFEIKAWDATTLTLFLPLPFPLSPGDSFTIEPGCDKTPSPSGCLKFQGYSSDGTQVIIAATNILNFRGDPFIPGTDLQLQYPDAQ